jgi:hypothetical protein
VDAVIQIIGMFALQESEQLTVRDPLILMNCPAYAPVLLERKAEQIRRSMAAEKAPHREIRTIFEGQDRS